MNDCDIGECGEALSKIDERYHPPILLSFQRTAYVSFVDEHDLTARDFRKADYVTINERLSAVNWSLLGNIRCIDDAVAYFTEIISRIVADCVPVVQPRRKPAWSNAELKRLKRRRSRAFRAYRSSHCGSSHSRFTLASRRYSKLNKKLFKRYVKRVERNLRTNPKGFWNYIKSQRKEDGLPATVFLDEEEGTTSSSKCSLFKDHFGGVFCSKTTTAEDVANAMEDVPVDRFDADVFAVGENDVELTIKKMKQSFAPGPDGIPVALLKSCCDSLKKPLAFLFSLSLETSTFPGIWKSSYMFPVFKKGDKQNVKNYRGITSLCACSKVFESIVNNYLFFRVKNYISTSQHGFFPGRSVSTNLLEFSSHCLRTLDQRLQIDAVYTDLKAAFDRVDHHILLEKLRRLGATGRLAAWFSTYLCGRRMAVKLGASQSEWFCNKSGVPQGSTLGPLLFSLFINDVTFLLPRGCRLLYADDLKIYLIIRSIDDCITLQRLLNIFAAWCRRNKLTLSIEKCNVISFHRIASPILFQYTIDGKALERSDCIKDLGVLLDAELTFNQHYSSIINKANKQLGMIFKIGKDFDPCTLRSLYCSLVRSILEAACVVWDPYYDVWSDRIERIQKLFVRRALRNLPWSNPENLPPYEDRCDLIGLQTLKQRRKRLKVTTAFKILTSAYDTPTLLAQLQVHCPSYPSRQFNLLRLNLQRTNYAMNEPIRAIAEEFNSHPDMFEF